MTIVCETQAEQKGRSQYISVTCLPTKLQRNCLLHLCRWSFSFIKAKNVPVEKREKDYVRRRKWRKLSKKRWGNEERGGRRKNGKSDSFGFGLMARECYPTLRGGLHSSSPKMFFLGTMPSRKTWGRPSSKRNENWCSKKSDVWISGLLLG